MRAIALALMLALPCSAQRLHLVSQPANCNITESAFDNPLSDSRGWTMPRLAWHASYAALSVGLALALNDVLHVPPLASALIASVGLGLVPHLRSAWRTREINARDWAFDLSTRSLPLARLGGARGLTAYAVSYATLVCFASP